MANWLTGIGYILSSVSVGLLAWVAWPAPGESRALVVAIIAGGLLSVVGMALRWAAHLIMHRKVEQVED
ncbi:hypothetical protein [Sphingopyxis sp. GW247-27LB]|uniref:hypothetical protein n=1 Tax=Sphingopyxis sp. GW247-27LB TaxID=2012632 RepID=UPI000BA6605B|nr:hypothetical protein [Sphingopyxis sp. GW247-27LB]PAL21683.1 hypothetical protein CD928_15090 [Sphingopyxis sp. GW247-27LB]